MIKVAHTKDEMGDQSTMNPEYPQSDVLDGKQLVDLSTPIYEGMPVYPGHQRTAVFDMKTHEETKSRYGEDALTTTTKGILVSDHGPTHTDALNHFNPADDALSIEEMPLHMFYTGAVCLDATHIQSGEDYLTTDDIKASIEDADLEIKRGDTVLLHTGHWNRNWGNEEWLTEYGGLTREATEWLADRGVVNIGIDAPSVDSSKEMGRRQRGEDDHYPSHQVCKERNITNTENMTNLDKVVDRRFTYIGFPLAVEGGTGSPIRAVALVDED